MPCDNYQPDHNGECLNCDESADGHTFPIGPHAKLAADCWRMIKVLMEGQTSMEDVDAAALNLIEMACDSAAEAAKKKP